MSKVERFEQLVAWQKARGLTREIYSLTKKGALCRDFRLATQIQAASVSIMSNVAEGFERLSLKEFHKFLSTAKASCAEVRSQLYVALDAGYVSPETFKAIYAQADEVARVIGGLRISVSRRIELNRKLKM